MDFSHVYVDHRPSISVRQWLLHPINTSNLQGPPCVTYRCEVRRSNPLPLGIVMLVLQSRRNPVRVSRCRQCRVLVRVHLVL